MNDEEKKAWDWFAAAALIGAMAKDPHAWSSAVVQARQAADKMLKEREERHKQSP